MEDKDKTKEQLIKELAQMRQEIVEQEANTAENLDKWRQAFVNNLTNGLYIVQDGKFIFANSMFRKYVGYSEEELYRMNSLNIVSAEDRDRVRESAVKMLKGERSSPYEFRYISKSREILYCMETVTSVQYQGRRAALGSFMDVTELRKSEMALRSFNLLLSIENKISNIFLTVPDDELYDELLQIILEATKSTYGIFGYVDEQETFVVPSLSRDIWDQCHMADKTIYYPREKWAGIWGRALAEKKTLYSNESMYVPHGHIPIERIVCVPIMAEERCIGLIEVANKPIDYNEVDIKFLESISDKIAPILNARLERDRENLNRRQAEEALKLQSDLLDIESDYVYVYDFEGNFIYANRMAYISHGYTKEELMNMNVSQLDDLITTQQIAIRRKEIREKGRITFEAVHLCKNGSMIPLEINAQMIEVNGRKLVMSVARDITERRQAEEALRHSEEHFRLLIENISDIIIISDANGFARYVSPSINYTLGYESEELIGKPHFEFIHPDDLPIAIDTLNQSIQTKSHIKTVDFRVRHKNGSWRTVQGIVTNLLDYPSVAGVVVYLRDITERKQTEKSLAESEQRYRTLFEMAVEGILIVDIETGELRYANPAFCRLLGYTAEELSRMRVGDIHPEEVREHVSSRFESQLRSEMIQGDLPYLKKDGTIIYMHVSAARATIDGRVCGIGFFTDITERMNMEMMLQQSNERMNAFIESSPDGFTLFDADLNLVTINQAALDLHPLGTRKEDVIGKNITELSPDVTDLEKYSALMDILKTGRQVLDENVVPHPRFGKRILNAKLFKVGDGLGIISTDITERKRTEEQLQESELKYRSLFEGMLNCFAYFKVMVDEKGQPVDFIYLEVNDAFEKLIGLRREDVIGKKVTEVIPGFKESQPKLIDTYGKVPLIGEGTRFEFHFPPLAKWLSISLYSLKEDYLIVFFDDITERKIAEEERQKAAKLESIGTLAGGIAHDFNNILTVILGNIQLAGSCHQKGRAETAQEMLAEAEKACFRARSLTQQLLTFSRGGAPVKKIIHVEKLLKESATFVLRGSACKPEFSLANDLWAVDADEGQLDQVINNLVINANQAMPGGGIINISASNLCIGKQRALSLREGRYLEITVKDYGIGIPERNKGRMFEPYFTTKQKGSGLGLATAYSIIKNHGGIITFESTLGVGTTFHVYLPATGEKVEEKTEKSAAAAQPLPLAQGRILVMDDEETIRKLLGRMLQSAGYEVELTKDGTDALQKYAKATKLGKPYDAVILDLTIPSGMGGEEVMAKLLEIDPGVKGIVSSGYANDPIMSDYRKYGFNGVVTKPYNLAQMQETLRDILADK